jgi:hypothetical protein
MLLESEKKTAQTKSRTVLRIGRRGYFKSSVPPGAVRPKPQRIPAPPLVPAKGQ